MGVVANKRAHDKVPHFGYQLNPCISSPDNNKGQHLFLLCLLRHEVSLLKHVDNMIAQKQAVNQALYGAVPWLMGGLLPALFPFFRIQHMLVATR